MKRTGHFLFWMLCICILACKSKFDAAQWNKNDPDWQWTGVREQMADDLIDSDTLIGMDTSQVYSLLGAPELITDSSRMFLIREKYTTNIDPGYIMYLNVIIVHNKVRKCTIYKTR